MFEIESKKVNQITIITKKEAINFDLDNFEIDAGLSVGKISGPGEFEIGEASIRGIDVGQERTIYEVKINGVLLGIIGGIEDGLDEMGVSDILCTSSVRAVREIGPKMVVAMGNVDGMVTDLKLNVRYEKKLKVKNADNLPLQLEVVALG